MATLNSFLGFLVADSQVRGAPSASACCHGALQACLAMCHHVCLLALGLTVTHQPQTKGRGRLGDWQPPTTCCFFETQEAGGAELPMVFRGQMIKSSSTISGLRCSSQTCSLGSVLLCPTSLLSHHAQLVTAERGGHQGFTPVGHQALVGGDGVCKQESGLGAPLSSGSHRKFLLAWDQCSQIPESL